MAEKGRIAPVIRYSLLALIGLVAFSSRLFSVIRFESIIHEFDPWFNYRCTEYLVQNGIFKFMNWFDETAWYPLGRVVGGTVYPGIMFTSAFIHYLINNIVGFAVSVKDVCVFLAPIFSIFTAISTYLLTKEVKDEAAGLIAASFIAVVPGYISRSVAGSYDNEGIAIFILMSTFYFWIRSVKTGSPMNAAITALFYYYMVSAWGGYVFIINMIPLHVFTLLLMGRYSNKLYIAYSTFYCIGTIASMTIPFVGSLPTRTSEHMPALGIFGLIQLVMFASYIKNNLKSKSSDTLIKGGVVFLASLMFIALVVLTITGKIAPWTGRFYSLFDTDYAKKHMPIIASVSEHQPTTWTSFFFDLNFLTFLFPAGLFFCFQERKDEHIFLILYSVMASYFAGVMIRLILTLAPIVCIVGSLAVSKVFDSFLSKQTDGKEGSVKLSTDSKLIVLVPLVYTMLMFYWHCTWVTSSAYSSPSVILSSSNPRTGDINIIDDFREAFYWLRQNTPKDSKVLSWWDYGYQLAGMAERTTITDNNTWNNTHIATVGRILALPEIESYEVMKSLNVNYVLVLSGAMSGFSGDDVNKFLWMVRIAEGVFPDVQESAFYSASGEYRVDSGASKVFQDSIMYKTSYYGMDKLNPSGQVPFDRARNSQLPPVSPQLSVLEEAYSTENYIVRIFKVKDEDVFGRNLVEAENFRRSGK